MDRKNHKISSLETVVLLLTLLFAAGTLFWFHMSRPEGAVTVIPQHETRQQAQPAERPEAPGMLEGEVLNLNTAPVADLTRLPGVGEKKAKAIVIWRESHGGFSAVEEILNVDGIGEKILEDINPYVTVEGGN